jgi:hypothetical protein
MVKTFQWANNTNGFSFDLASGLVLALALLALGLAGSGGHCVRGFVRNACWALH